MNDHIFWKPVFGYEGIYEVNNFGHIKTNNRIDRRMLSQQSTPLGHKYVMITNKHKVRKKKYAHTAVLESFSGMSRPNGMECRHLDGNPENNNLFNLKWGTHSENMQDSIFHGTFNFVGKPGEKHANSILSNEDVRQIREYFKDIKMTNRMIGDKYGVDLTTISKIRNGKNWSHLK